MRFFRRLVALPLGLILVVPSCSDDAPSGPLLGGSADPRVAAINAFFDGLPPWPRQQPNRPADSPRTTKHFVVTDAFHNKYDYRCGATTRHTVSSFNSQSGAPLLAPGLDNPDVLPGALMQGRGLAAGQLKLLAMPRAPVTLMLNSIASSTGSTQALVAHPTSANLRDSVVSLVRRLQGAALPADVHFVADGAYSYSQAMNAVGVHGSYGKPFDAKLGDSVTVTATKRAVIATLRQNLFSISIDLSAVPNPASLFDESVTSDDLKTAQAHGAIGNDNLPVIIRTVTYGRVMTFIATSDSASSDAELQASIDASYKEFTGGGNATAHQKAILANTHFVAVVFGGPQSAANAAIADQDWRKFFTATVDASVAVPISYEIVTADGNDPAVIYDVAQYESLDSCERPTGYNFTVKWDSVAVQSAACVVDHDFKLNVGRMGVISSFKVQHFSLPAFIAGRHIGQSVEIPFSEPALDSLQIVSEIITPVIVDPNRALAKRAYAYPFNFLTLGHTTTAHDDLGGGATCGVRMFFSFSKVPRYQGA